MISKGCTPTFTFTFPQTSSVDLTQAAHVYVTFVGSRKTIEKSDTDLTIEAKSVAVYLGQDETLALSDGVVSMQINWTYGDGSRAASEIVRCQLCDNLIERVVE